MLFKRLAFLVLVLGFIIAIGVAIKAHDGIIKLNDVTNPHLHFIGKPEITCNIDGKYFRHTRIIDGHGNVMVDSWYEEPRTPIVSIKAEAHGFGWAYTTFSGNIDGKPFGDSNSKNKRLGFWFGISSIPVFHGDYRIFYEERGKFNYAEGEYSWNGKGTVKLVPYIWQWRLTGKGVGGEWIPAPDDSHSEKEVEADGKWTVKHSHSSVVSIDYNKTVFNVYETLEVTVKKPDLYVANMYIDGNLVQSTYASGSQVVLRKTWNTGDRGIRTVKIEVYYGDDGAHSTTQSSPVTVQ